MFLTIPTCIIYMHTNYTTVIIHTCHNIHAHELYNCNNTHMLGAKLRCNIIVGKQVFLCLMLNGNNGVLSTYSRSISLPLKLIYLQRM